MEGFPLLPALPQQSQQNFSGLLWSSPPHSVSILFGKSFEFFMDQEKMQALRNLSLWKGSFRPCFGLSALYTFILLSIFLPSPCPRPKLSTGECSGQLLILDRALREELDIYSTPLCWPTWFHPLVTQASSFGLSPLVAPNPVLGVAV